jgi:hypothetical protein
MKGDPMYQIHHVYLAAGDDGQPVVEVETATAQDPLEIVGFVRRMVEAPGGRSGTTLALTVTPTEATSL